MLAGSCKRGTIGKCKTRTQKVAKSLMSGRSGIQHVAMVTKLVYSYCGAHLVEINISETNLLRHL